MNRTSTEVIQDHLAKRLVGDIEGDISTNFSEDVIILSSYGTFRGHEGVRDSAAKLKKAMGNAIFAYNHTMIEGDFAFLEWSGESQQKKVSDGADSFVVKNGKIILQTIHYSPKQKSHKQN